MPRYPTDDGSSSTLQPRLPPVRQPLSSLPTSRKTSIFPTSVIWSTASVRPSVLAGYPCVSCSAAGTRKQTASKAPDRPQDDAGKGFTSKLTMVYYRPDYTAPPDPAKQDKCVNEVRKVQKITSDLLNGIHVFHNPDKQFSAASAKETSNFRNTQDMSA